MDNNICEHIAGSTGTLSHIVKENKE